MKTKKNNSNSLVGWLHCLPDPANIVLNEFQELMKNRKDKLNKA